MRISQTLELAIDYFFEDFRSGILQDPILFKHYLNLLGLYIDNELDLLKAEERLRRCEGEPR